jgi:hypothetical protein
VDNLWSLINSSFNTSNSTNTTQASFLALTNNHSLGIIQILDYEINNTLPIFQATDVSALQTTVGNGSIIYNLMLTNTNGYIIIGVASNSPNSTNTNVTEVSLLNGTDDNGTALLGFFKQYSLKGVNYEFSFTNLTGNAFEVYFAAGSDTFEPEQLWTTLYQHNRTLVLGGIKLAFMGVVAFGLLLVFLN